MKALKDENLKLCIAVENNIPIGTIRGEFDPEKRIYKVSWTIAPQYRNQGLGKTMANLFITNCKEKIRVEIKKDDIFSQKIAAYLKMNFDKEVDWILHYSK